MSVTAAALRCVEEELIKKNQPLQEKLNPLKASEKYLQVRQQQRNEQIETLLKAIASYNSDVKWQAQMKKMYVRQYDQLQREASADFLRLATIALEISVIEKEMEPNKNFFNKFKETITKPFK